MTKRWLWYVCIGLICCSSLAYVYAKQTTGVSKLRTNREVLMQQLADVEHQIKMTGGSPELEQLATKLRDKLYPETRPTVSDATIQKLADGARQAEIMAAEEALDGAAQLSEDSYESEKDAFFAHRATASVSELQLWAERGVELTDAENERVKLAIVEEDNRTEDEVNPLDAQGGPDSYGYRWVDNLDGDTATYLWEDIVGVPGAVNLTAIGNHDDAATPVALTFTFPFYNASVTTIYPSSNGALGMTSVTAYSNTCTLPTSSFPSGGIWPFWDDQHTGRGGTGVSGTVSDSGSVWVKDEGNRVIVQWDSVGRLSPTYQHTYTYQAILYSSGKIKLQYKDIHRYAPSTTLPTATIGIQQGSTAPNNNYLTYSCATTGSTAQDTLRDRAVWFYLDQTATGRCCYLVAGTPTCAENTSEECAALGGQWGGPGTTCAANPCPTARCCYNGGADCETTTQLRCTFLAGTWTTGLTCEANPCPVALQGTDHCADAPLVTVGGTFTGTTVGSTAETETIPACESGYSTTAPGVWYRVVGNGDSLRARMCSSSPSWDSELFIFCGECAALTCVGGDDDGCGGVGLSVQDWASVNGTTYYILVTAFGTATGAYNLEIIDLGAYTGAPINCSPTGRCCYLQGGAPQCADLLAADCAALGGQFTATTTCAATPCPTGRCCYVSGGTGQCAINTQLECNALTGTWTSGITDCVTSPCPTGRCCYLDGNNMPACLIDQQSVCTALGGAFTSGITDCFASPCATARCCYNDGTSCETTTLQRCTFLTGTWTSGSTCEANPCPIPPVNDNCAGAILIDVDAYCSASVVVNTTTATLTIGDTCDFDSNGPDVFYKLILADCRRIAMKAEAPSQDTHISIYPEGVCAVVPALCCNDDHANFGENGCAVPAWDVAAQHPIAYSLNSYMALEIGPGTYYIRAGKYSTSTGIYTLTVYDNGPCVQSAGCQPGDIVTNVTVHRDSLTYQVGVPPYINPAGYVTLRWTNTNAGDYNVWSSINPLNDGDPDGPDADLKAGDDPMWTLETLTPLALPVGPVSWDRPAGFEAYVNFVVTPDCDPTPPMGQCCYVNNGSHTCAYVSEAQCNTLAGTWTINLTCDCPATACPSEGRCCYLDVNNHGACADILQTECTALSGVWTAGVTCASAPCELGRCCYLDANNQGACADVIELECDFLGGTWTAGVTCASAPCVTAACCYNAGTTCNNLQDIECAFLGGTWYSGEVCANFTCPVPPSNDLCANAIPVAIPSTTAGSTFLATAEALTIPACGTGYNSTSTGVWYTVVGNGDSLRVSMCSTSPVWDSEIFVFCGGCASFTCIGGDDDACGGGTIFAVNSQLDWASENGVTYYVLIAGWLAGDEGDFTLDVSDLGPYTVTPITCP